MAESGIDGAIGKLILTVAERMAEVMVPIGMIDKTCQKHFVPHEYVVSVISDYVLDESIIAVPLADIYTDMARGAAWCHENIDNQWCSNACWFYFEKEADAMLFKLSVIHEA